MRSLETNNSTFPASAIIPTRNRAMVLRATLASLSRQSKQPAEIIVIDASDKEDTHQLCKALTIANPAIVYLRAVNTGAAVQRNEGIAQARYNYILLLDDDLLFEDQCIERLYNVMEMDPNLGGVNAMITNQKYHPPGKLSRVVFRFLNGGDLTTYAGKCLGPVMNLLPDDNSELPEVVPVEWLNTTCTLYRRSALPSPTFPPFFKGYSMYEDVALSVEVGKKWKLANARTARVYHDSQPGDHKSSMFTLSKMELVNRYFVMTRVLHRKGFLNSIKLMVVECYKIASYLKNTKTARFLPAVLAGKLAGSIKIIFYGVDHE